MTTKHIVTLISIAICFPSATTAQNPEQVSAADLLRQYAEAGDPTALHWTFHKCPSRSLRNDSLFTALMRVKLSDNELMNVAALWIGGNRQCNDPRLMPWLRKQMFDANRSANARSSLAQLLLYVRPPNGTQLVRDWVFSDTADELQRGLVLVQLAEVLPDTDRLNLFVHAFGAMTLPSAYLPNELSHFARVDFDGSRRRMLRALRETPRGASAVRLIHALSAESKTLGSQNAAWKAELRHTLEALAKGPDGSVPTDVRRAARSALDDRNRPSPP